jgi:hypothetical protein
MTSTINASTSSGIVQSADTSGILQLQTANTAALTIDASQNVGIGTASPSSRLHVTSSAAGSYSAIIYNTSATGQGLTVRGGSTSSQDAFNVQTYDGNTSLLSVQAGGNVGIGTASPTEKLTVNGNIKLGTSGTNWIYGPSTTGRSIYSNSDSSAYIVAYGSAYGSSLDSVLQLTAGTSSTAMLNATGSFSLAGATRTANGTGITFPAAQSASTNANTLDDYEEGTWTPAYGATFSSITYGASFGAYTKIGNLVTVWGSINVTAVSGGSGALTITGLPFTVGANSDETGGPVGLCLAFTNAAVVVQQEGGATILYVMKNTTNSGNSGSDVQANSTLRFTCSYIVA